MPSNQAIFVKNTPQIITTNEDKYKNMTPKEKRAAQKEEEVQKQQQLLKDAARNA